MDIEEHLKQFHWDDPSADLKQRILNPAQQISLRRRRWPWVAAAAVLLLAVGASIWITLAARRSGEVGFAGVEILHGRGRVVPVAADTQFTILDAAQGRVRLERGEVFVEVDADPTLSAEVETPTGTARVQGTRFYAHYSNSQHGLLAAFVLNGKLEIQAPLGRTTCTAGDVAFAQSGFAPHKHSGVSKHPGKHHRGFCPFVSTLGLIYRPHVQRELRLGAEQKARLQRPGKDERREICRFFQSLQGISRNEWAQRTNEFCAELERKMVDVLDAGQQKRLREITYQQEGYFALLRAELIRELDVKQDQQESIERLLREFADTRRALLDRQLPAAEYQRAVVAAWHASLTQAETLLTQAQKQQWAELIGSRFELLQEF